MKAFLFPVLGLSLLAAPVARANFAAANEIPVKLDPYDVNADPTPTPAAPDIDTARHELALTPGGTEVVDAESYLRGRASTVADTFAYSPGVFAQSRFGSDEARLSIRGSGLQRTFHGRGLRVLQDGVPINLADGSFDFQAIEPLSTAYVDIWRGANALALGASTLGGAIDYISRNGRDAPSLMARLEAGSYGYVRASVAAGVARGKSDACVSFTEQAQDGFREHARQDNRRLFSNFGWRLSPSQVNRVYITAVRTHSELPGNLTKARLAGDPRAAAPDSVALDQHRNYDLLRIADKFTWVNHGTRWQASAAWNYKDLDHPIYQVLDQLSNDLWLSLSADHQGAIGGHDQRLRAGVNFSRGWLNAANFVNAGGQRGALLAQARQLATNVEAFAEDQIKISRHATFILGFNAARNRRENRQTFGSAPSYTLNYGHLSPKIGLRWDVRDVQFYTNVSGSYEPPSFSETLTNRTAREAQTATTVEIGSRGTRGALRWDASVYAARVRHELLALVDPATQLSTTLNADRTTHSGAELSSEIDLLGQDWSATPAHRLVLHTAWTYGRFRFDRDPVYGHNTLAGLPPHLIRGELVWETLSGWYAGPNFEWVPQKTFVDHRNTLAADPYAIAGFRFGRRVEHGLSWFMEVRNIFDRTYAATTGVIENANGTDQAQFLPGDGRSVFAGAEWRW